MSFVGDSLGSTIAILLGWPAVTVGCLVLLVAAALGSRPIALLGCIFVTPMLLYFTATPRFRYLALVVLVSLVALAWHTNRSRPVIRIALALPAALTLGLIAYSFLPQVMWHVA